MANDAFILVAEDHDPLRAMFVSALRAGGFDAVGVANGQDALDTATRRRPDLLLLDIQLPGLDGLQVLTEVRRLGDVPIILVTGRGEEVDRVVGLELGADDYMVKPVYPRELVARVRAVLRRAPIASPTGALVFGSLLIDAQAREVSIDGASVALPPRELDLLIFLASHPRQAFSRQQILEQVWDSSPQWQDPATVTEHVRRLRNTLAKAAGGQQAWVSTVRGSGYRFDP